MSDFDDDSKTPPRLDRQPGRPLTDSEREVFRIKYESGVPSVVDPYDHEDTSPIDLFERAPVDRSQRHAEDLVGKLRRHPEKLIPFLGEFTQWVVTRMREQSSSERAAVEELRELLSKPPNGATKRLQDQVTGLEGAVAEMADRLEEAEQRADRAEERAEKAEARLASVEGTIKSAKGNMWKAALAVATTIAGSAVAVITSWQAGAEKAGAAAERDRNQELRLDRHERLLDDRQRPQRRDYDYDIAPRPAPLKDKP